MRQEDRQAQIRENAFGGTAKHEVPDAGVTISAHDKQVAADLESMLLKRCAD